MKAALESIPTRLHQSSLMKAALELIITTDLRPLTSAIMSEALDKVRGVRELPLFPLPLVLFPGVPLPLHIFEERYQRLLADVRVSNNLFGLSYFDPGSSAEDRPAAGSACRPDRSVQG